MFTGIVEGKRAVVSLHKGEGGASLRVDLEDLVEGVRTGDSIAISGCCLTVVGVTGTNVEFQLTPETLGRTKLGSLRDGDAVNVERSMRADARFGGHLVLGHVDCVADVVNISEDGDSRRLRIDFPQRYNEWVVEKGSVALDGVSLTVASCGHNWLEVVLVPHTIMVTTLGTVSPGDRLDVEFDIVGKYVARLHEAWRHCSR